MRMMTNPHPMPSLSSDFLAHRSSFMLLPAEHFGGHSEQRFRGNEKWEGTYRYDAKSMRAYPRRVYR